MRDLTGGLSMVYQPHVPSSMMPTLENLTCPVHLPKTIQNAQVLSKTFQERVKQAPLLFLQPHWQDTDSGKLQSEDTGLLC